jgi:predicted metalloprotease
METYLNDAVECLMYTWYPAVLDSDFYMPRPSVTVYSSEIATGCGKSINHNAFYCGTDQQIYFSADLIAIFSSDVQATKYLGAAVLAHEYAHAIQWRTMILISRIILQQDLDTDEEKWALTRRSEAQADCMAGLFMHAVADANGLTSAQATAIQGIFADIGSATLYEDDHGASVTRKYWSGLGLQNSLAGTCETWSVDDEKVG